MNDFYKFLYEIKTQLLYRKGLEKKKIVPFDEIEGFYKKMNHIYFNGLPISMHIKYLRPIIEPYRCYDRSLYMFYCFENAVLVRADVKPLEVEYGKEQSGHGWIEIDNYVYDPTSLLRFEKDLYYEICKPSNITMCTKESYPGKEYYEKIRSTTIEDLKTDMEQRANLIVSIPIIKEIAKYSNNQEFIDELDEHLNKINYDYDEIVNEMNKTLLLK